jgi:hypothetical protein
MTGKPMTVGGIEKSCKYLDDKIFYVEGDIPEDVEKTHKHSDGMCIKALYCKREDQIYITHIGEAYFCDEPLIA